uniref:Putative secreted protein n=1 Tax=Anopheles triannulatus TaxID=58253 RepID=A0A2M4B7G0_9DIPT
MRRVLLSVNPFSGILHSCLLFLSSKAAGFLPFSVNLVQLSARKSPKAHRGWLLACGARADEIKTRALL